MSILSVTCTTAIKAVIHLAKLEDGVKAGVRDIAKAIKGSEHTVGKLLQVLVRAEVICSLKGPAGGFYVTTKQKNQPIINIIYSIDGKQVFDQCGLGLSKCSSTRPCPLHKEYKLIRDEFESLCRRSKVGKLCEMVDEGLSFLAG